MRILITISILFIQQFLFGQYLTGIATKWSDSFSEWYIYTDVEGEEGELKQRWALRNDWTEWEYRQGEHFGRIKLKWRNNFNEWEIRGGNEVVTARTLWNDNFREWRISGNGTQLSLNSRYGNTFDEWEIRKSDHGLFEMYTNWEGDPRDWNVVDELDERIGFTMKMAMIFIALYQSVPK